MAISASIAPLVGAAMLDTWPDKEGLIISTFFRAVTALLLYLWVFRGLRGKGNIRAAAKTN